MTVYSATSAISPAIESTKQFLFRPFRVLRFLKLTLVAALVEGGITSCNVNSGFPTGKDGPWNQPLHLPSMHWPAVPILIGLAIAAVLIVVPINILIGYLLIRLRFSFFDCALRRQKLIAPAWRLYHRQALRYLGLSICLGVAFSIFLGAAGFGVYRHFKPLFATMGSQQAPNLGEILSLLAVVFPLIMLFVLAYSLVDIALSNFVLPRMALEDATIYDSLSDVWDDIRAEPWPFVFFVFMRFLLSLAASIMGMIVVMIPFIFVAGIGAVVVFLLKGISVAYALLFGIPAAILVLGLFLLVLIGLSGTIGTFRRYYGLYFYAGRYPPIGAILEPPLPPAAFPPPVPPWISAPMPGSEPGAAQG